MPNWTAFAGFASVVLFALLVLSHASKGLVSDGSAHTVGSPTVDADSLEGEAGDTADEGDVDRGSVRDDRDVAGDVDDEDGADAGVGSATPLADVPDRSTADGATTNLLLNVAISQALFAAFLLLGAWYAEIPASAVGVRALDAWTLAVGVGVGVALYAVNEVGSTVGERFGLGGADDLREALSPESAGGWALLLLVVLPTVAGFEELLFRGVLVGAVSVGFAVSPWAMAAVSSVAFALGHGAQGPGGVLVTGALGFVLAATFVLTGSLLAVVLAHYLVNALEFVVHEGVGVEF